ncbi:SAF domain-containing protein [Arthrobacter sp.]|uniref:SAF domain-containing protein n=1 Tax=Arthrobacter sp. TaxID=1667 RepID=UPI003390E630
MSAAIAEKTAAPRLKRPSWRDPRLLVGLLLVLASVAGVSALVATADQTVGVLAAKSDIAVGQPVSAGDLVVVDVRLGEASARYLSADAGLPSGAVATALIRGGELLPASVLGTADDLDRKPIGLNIDSPLPDGAGPGSRVDVWVSLPDGRNGFDQPEMLLAAAEVSQLADATTAFGSSGAERLHVLVGDDTLPALLHALANGARINVVLNPGGSS